MSHIFKLLLVLLMAFSCEKKEDPGREVQKLLTSGRWYWERDSESSYSPCMKRSYFEFKEDGTMLIKTFFITSSNCSSAENQAKYTLENEGKTLVTSTSTIPRSTYTIVTLTETELVLDAGKVEYTYDRIEG